MNLTNIIEGGKRMNKEDVKLIRKLMGLTQYELANQLGYSKCYVGYVEQGLRPVTKKLINKIRNVYGLDAADLSGYKILTNKIKGE